MRLITDFKMIEQAVGIDITKETLMATGTFDAPRDLSPIVVQHDHGYYFIVLGFEKGNFDVHGVAHGLRQRSDVEILFYRPYFTWDTIDEDRLMAVDEASALARLVKEGSALESDPDVPLERFQKFAARFDVKVTGWKEPGEFLIYRIEPADVLSLFSKGLSEARDIASSMLDALTSMSQANKITVRRIMEEAQDLRFENLDVLMGEHKIEAVFAASRVNIQELAGLPWDAVTDDLIALYDGKYVFVLSPRELDLPHGQKVGVAANLNKALEELLGDAVLGIEEKNIPIGLYNYIRSEKKNAGNMLRFWRERQGVFNLPYFIMAAQAARYSMERACEILEAQIKRGEKVTEQDLRTSVQGFFPKFQEKYHLPVELRKSHCAINAGVRTPYPALPADFALDASCRSIKIDTGVQVFKNNFLYAVSDMARTLVFSPEAQEMQGYLDRSMLEFGIPACRDGRTGAEIHKDGMALLLEKMERIRELKMVPEGRELEKVYTRNIGHLLGGKQQPTIMFFTPADKVYKTEEGMIGCVEYQWPIAGHSIGSEDMFLVTKTHGINFTR